MREAPGANPWSLCATRLLAAYFSSAIAASAFAFAVVMSPDLHAASASLISAVALLVPAGLEVPADRGAWLS